jgi:hypothetical protein
MDKQKQHIAYYTPHFKPDHNAECNAARRRKVVPAFFLPFLASHKNDSKAGGSKRGLGE